MSAVLRSFDFSHDWRASSANLASRQQNIDANRQQGLAAGYQERVHAAIKASLEAGHPFAELRTPPTPLPSPAPATPFTGRAFLLTDNACFSACLDFADLLRNLPGVTHVGLPTGADVLYIDNTGQRLPSGLMNLSYLMKVYRNRIRGHNEWYKPAVRWPGGEMTDEAVTRWIASLR